MPISETTIRQWADLHDCRIALPILVRRLVRETTLGLQSLRFPGNEAVDLAGLDGQVESDRASTWVPAGRSIWEMGCDQTPLSKASRDFGKRTTEIPENERRQSSFVFVTPRRWQGKEVWLQEQREKGDWAGVRAYDATDLETWLEEAPITDRWLGERLGLSHPGLLTPEEWWKRWSSASTPPITCRLVATRRHNEADVLLGKLRANEPVVTVLADDRSEAAAFVFATLAEAEAHDLLDRVIFVTAGNITVPHAKGSHAIIVADLPEDEEPDFGDRQGMTIVRPYPRARGDVEHAIQLSHVPSSAFREELEAMGFSRDEADSQAVKVGHSVPVLRRQLSPDPAVRRPVWARDRISAKRMLPFAIAGSWVEQTNQYDRTVLSLIAEWTEDEISTIRDDLLMLNEAPIARYGNVNVTVSQLDALFAVGLYLTKEDLDRFYQLLPELLAERDPALDLPADRRWMADVLGKGRRYSEALISGLKDTLCILTMHGRQICGDRLGIDFAHWANDVVNTLMTDADEERWLTIRKHLRSLAEAAPNTFLECLESELSKDQPAIQAIMGTTGETLGGGECLRTDLLWALEALAWDASHFARVAEVVFLLQRIPIDDNWSNNPASTAQSMFRAWWPSTSLGVGDRLSILRKLSRNHRIPAIDVCISLLPRVGSQFGTLTARSRWRVSVDPISDGTDQDFQQAAIGASHLLLDMAPFEKNELKRVLDALAGLHADDVPRLVAETARWSAGASETERAELTEIFRQSHTYRSVGKQDGDLLAAMENIASDLEPRSMVERHRWLFQRPHVEWRKLVEAEMNDQLPWQARDALVRKIRADALREIELEIGRDGLLFFAIKVNHPEIVADALLAAEAGPDVAAEWVELVLRNGIIEASKPFLRRLLFGTVSAPFNDTLFLLKKKGILRDPEFCLRLAEQFPGDARGWETAAHLGVDAEKAYWSSVHIRIWDDTPSTQVEHVVTCLLKALRPRAAFDAAYYHPAKLSPELWEQVLRGVVRVREANEPQLPAYGLAKVFQYLDKAPSFTDERIANLELPFTRLLCPHGHRHGSRDLAIHRQIARNPADFIQLLRLRYTRNDHAPEADLDKLSDDNRSFLASVAFDLLEGWNTIPGMNAEGEIDAVQFRDWIKEALRLAKEVDRVGVAQLPMADLLARLARHRSWEDWLPEPVLNLLDQPEHNGLRDRFPIAIYNARGVTVRSPYDGGTQERDLAENYRKLAIHYSRSYPRVAATLTKIAEGYEFDARGYDNHAALDERFRN